MTDFRPASRYLSYVLRHSPDSAGLVLDGSGWADVEEVLTALQAAGHAIGAEGLRRLVQTNDKQRFELSDGRIRAAQGHSIDVDLALPAVSPPAVLYHGTVARFLPSIRARGLVRGRRRHVHLSEDEHTARVVGSRRGKPVVLRIDSRGMHAAGTSFFRSPNGVWLVDAVPARWISETPAEPSC